MPRALVVCFFFNFASTSEVYTLSLHDALPILAFAGAGLAAFSGFAGLAPFADAAAGARCFLSSVLWCSSGGRDRKSTRLNSSHSQISYAVFCLENETANDAGGGLDLRQERSRR